MLKPCSNFFDKVSTAFRAANLHFAAPARDSYFLAAVRALEVLIVFRFFKTAFYIAPKILYFPNEIHKLTVFRLALGNIAGQHTKNIYSVKQRRNKVQRPKSREGINHLAQNRSNQNPDAKLISAVSSVHELPKFL